MRIFLLFLSSILAFFAFGLRAQDMPSDSTAMPTQRYVFQIDTGKAGITGILIMRQDEDAVRGCMINEFGVSALDFVYSRKSRKVKLLSVVSFLDKWYIRPVLRKDLACCVQELLGIPFTPAKNYSIEHTNDNTVILNRKRHLKYTFSPLKNYIPNDDSEE